MSKHKRLRDDLEGFKKTKQPEMKLRLIEKWMIKKLGVVREKNPGGSKIIYSHALIEKYEESGRFRIDKIHGKHKDNDMVRTRDFKTFLYPRLVRIIEYLEMEESIESK